MSDDSYTMRDLAQAVQAQMAIHGKDAAKILEGIREPVTKILNSDLDGIRRDARGQSHRRVSLSLL